MSEMVETAPDVDRSAGPERTEEGATKKGSTSPPASRRFLLVLILFLLVSQSLLVLASAEPYWWAALPVLSLTGVVGWRSRWFFATLLGFVVGFGYWGVELALLPSVPRARLAAVLSGALGASPTVVYLVGPLLLGALAACAATSLAGALRLFEDLRRGIPKDDGINAGAEPSAGTTASEA